MLQLLAMGANRFFSLAVAILVAIACTAFIVFNHKIQNILKNTGVRSDE
jgi:hypothetical protein